MVIASADYAGDCNIYVRSLAAGQRVMESVVQFLEEKLRLRVNRDKGAVAKRRRQTPSPTYGSASSSANGCCSTASSGCPTKNRRAYFKSPNVRATTRGRNKIRGGADSETTR